MARAKIDDRADMVGMRRDPGREQRGEHDDDDDGDADHRGRVAAEAMPVLLGVEPRARRRRAHARPPRMRTRGSTKPTSTSIDEIGDDEEHARDHHHAHDGVEVLLQDAAHAVARHARPGEHEFDDEGVADQRSEFEAEDRHRRHERGPQHVFEHAHAVGHAERAAPPRCSPAWRRRSSRRA